MSDRKPRFPSLEDALGEADAAARGGVFRRTSLDARQLLSQSPAVQTGGGSAAANPHRSALSGRAARGWLAAAAVFALLGVGWNLIFFREFGEMRERLAIKDNKSRSMAVLACVAGPIGDLAQDCNSYDYDSDGDVDMADVQSYQLALALDH